MQLRNVSNFSCPGPDDWEAHTALANVYWKFGRSADALEQLDRAINIHPNSADLSGKAVALLALQIELSSDASHFLLANALLQQGHLDAEVVRHLTLAAKTLPQARASLKSAQQKLAEANPDGGPAAGH